MGSTLEAAYTLSESLIEEAFDHVRGFFNNTNWLRDNRKMGSQLEYVYWVIPGRHQLSCEELDQLVLRMKAEGWPNASWSRQGNHQTSNWELRLSIPQSRLPAASKQG